MNSTLLIEGIGLGIILVSGFWLTQTGKPYSVILLTLHKLLSVGALVWLVVIARRASLSAALTRGEILACAVTLLFFLVMIATGGILSAAKPAAALVTKLHHVAPYLTVLSSAATIYLLQIRHAV